MVSIQKAYYHGLTDQLHIIVYMSKPRDFEIVDLISDVSIHKLSKTLESEYGYRIKEEARPLSIVPFDLDAASGNYYQAHIYINVEDIEPIHDSFPEFDASGITRVEFVGPAGGDSKLIVNADEFYDYKMTLLDGETGDDIDPQFSKKMTRFSFYEQMLAYSADRGYTKDAFMFYSQMKRMATYGLPFVKKVLNR